MKKISACICILLSLLTACTPAGTSAGSSSVPETVSSAPSTSSEVTVDSSSALAVSSETTSDTPVSSDPASTGQSEQTGYQMKEFTVEARTELLNWSLIEPGWTSNAYTMLYYNGTPISAVPGYIGSNELYTIIDGNLFIISPRGTEVYMQTTPDSVPEFICEVPLYEQIEKLWYVSYESGVSLYIMTSRSRIYSFDLNSGEMIHLGEIPSDMEDVVFVAHETDKKDLHIRAATEETYRLWEELESRRGDTIPHKEKVAQCVEIYNSYDMYRYNLETGVKTPYTEEEYINITQQLGW